MFNAQQYFEVMLNLWDKNHTENLAMIEVWISKLTEENK
jgi:hypothetical protein